MAQKILLVDDDAALRKMIRRYLESHSYSVVDTDQGSEALLLAKETRPDLVLTDAEMPGLDGHSLCRVLRQETVTNATPLIIMSGARVKDENILAGFESGADDYLLKPIALPVLEAKIKAVLRRYGNKEERGEKLEKLGMELDPLGRALKINGKPVTLTRKEFDLLILLVNKAGRVLSVSFLLENVWGYDAGDYTDPGTVEVHISHLRKKLGPKLGTHIVNVTGYGYKFEDSPS